MDWLRPVLPRVPSWRRLRTSIRCGVLSPTVDRFVRSFAGGHVARSAVQAVLAIHVGPGFGHRGEFGGACFAGKPSLTVQPIHVVGLWMHIRVLYASRSSLV